MVQKVLVLLTVLSAVVFLVKTFVHSFSPKQEGCEKCAFSKDNQALKS
jgi:hypothetical protein